MMIDQIIFVVILGLAIGLAGGKILELIYNYIIPKCIKKICIRIRYYYLYPFRLYIPDYVYKLWLRTGIMTEQNYRQFQEHGFISDDLDPTIYPKT